jgi:hypothetical protein
VISQAERALCEIERRLKSVRVADGYHTDSGLHVSRSTQRTNLAYLPAIVIWDSGEDPRSKSGDLPSGSFNLDLKITVEVYAKANLDNTGEVLEQLKADVKRSIFGNGNSHGALGDSPERSGKIGAIGYTGATAFPRAEGAASEGISMTFTVRYSEDFAKL